MIRYFLVCSVLVLGTALPPAEAQVERIWLTHQYHDPSRIVINWETTKPTASVVRYGTTEEMEYRVALEGERSRHHVDVSIPGRDLVWFYQVGDGAASSEVHSFKSYPSEQLRVAVVGDWGYAPQHDLSALVKDDVHLIITAGDNVASLHEKGREGTKAFSAFIDRYPEIFRSTPLMPILGNHDREITPRGPKPPDHSVYDVRATAYRDFFALPVHEWVWHFDIPDFGVRFVALDLNHITDVGTTWQAFDEKSEQFEWYKNVMRASGKFGQVVTLMNERQSTVAGQTKGIWHEQFNRGTALISGFGYFAERAELRGGLPYFNTCLKGDGNPYKDANSKFFAQEHHYLLLKVDRAAGDIEVLFKNLEGNVLDTSVVPKRKR
ncbi:hypothetical protein FEM03_13590 [Phragmitibacter flavus]|uniref:Calcineurin-like phosphoesterase domain-containing protein n=1 Tax=Phragmitibacter flavus TaxID=2576071 RepID=A0A5R8KD32_9BACT|nr:metallophosphoesterase [Phragmitibacter flavus]TLD70216.1 hypothetical protein FEM03_13590 [Phragmitibacter flavus]